MAIVLAIDDDKGICEILKVMLLELNHHPFCLLEENDIVSAILKSKADVVMLDICMPGKEGVTYIREIRNHFPNLPIIAISGATNYNQFFKNAILFGANATLAKPCTMAQLNQTINSVLKCQEVR